MKNAMKKLMSLVLVAMILVSALPFAASAAESDPCTKDYACLHTGVQHIAGCPKIPCNPAACDHGGYEHQADCPKACNGQKDCAQYAAGNTDAAYHVAGCLAISKADEVINDGVACSNSYDCKHTGNLHIAGCPMIPCSNDASCDHGGWNHLETCPFACRNSEACHAWYHLDTCPVKVAADKKEEETTTPETDDNKNVVDEEWMKDIYLYIYTNNDIIAPAKRVLLNNYLVIKDHTLDKNEILSVVDDYYKASNSNNGIIWKGAYMENANIDAINFVNGRNEVPFEDLDVARSGASAVVIKVRVTGVTATSSSSNADTTNPKTGDEIYKAVTVMAVSASALAMGFYFNKKRAIQ